MIRGFSSWCRECKAASSRASYQAHREERIAAAKKYGEEHREERLLRERGRYHEERRAQRMLARYGITVEQYDEMLATQGGGCAICGSAADGNGRYLHIDHDHETGAVRGILCSNCNRALGHLRDEPALIEIAMEYLASAS